MQLQLCDIMEPMVTEWKLQLPNHYKGWKRKGA